MPKKKGTPSVTPEKRLLWLKRRDKGDSVFKIANEAGVDHRTVSKHIEIARSERELKEERSAVFRNALERHFADLINVVDVILYCIDTLQAAEFSDDNELLKDALKEHIPHSSIWSNLRRWNSDIMELTRLETLIRDKMKKRLLNDKELSSINERKDGELFKSIHAALKYNSKDMSRRLPAFDVESPVKEVILTLSRTIESTIPGFIDLEKKDAAVVKDVISKIEKEMEGWGEFAGLRHIYSKSAGIQTRLKNELRILKWKRIVPGRCRLCPM